MSINLSRFSDDENLTKALGFSSDKDFILFNISALDTCIAIHDDDTFVDFISMLHEDEIIALWPTFARLVDLDTPEIGLMVGSSLSDICKAAAYNNFSGFNTVLNNISKEIFEEISKKAKSIL